MCSWSDGGALALLSVPSSVQIPGSALHLGSFTRARESVFRAGDEGKSSRSRQSSLSLYLLSRGSSWLCAAGVRVCVSPNTVYRFLF